MLLRHCSILLHNPKEFFSTLFYVSGVIGGVIALFLQFPTIFVIMGGSVVILGVGFYHVIKPKKERMYSRNEVKALLKLAITPHRYWCGSCRSRLLVKHIFIAINPSSTTSNHTPGRSKRPGTAKH